MVTSMVEIGEETGELPDMLTRIADNYDEDVDNAKVAGMTSLIEPVMIVFLAVDGGFIMPCFYRLLRLSRRSGSSSFGVPWALPFDGENYSVFAKLWPPRGSFGPMPVLYRGFFLPHL